MKKENNPKIFDVELAELERLQKEINETLLISASFIAGSALAFFLLVAFYVF